MENCMNTESVLRVSIYFLLRFMQSINGFLKKNKKIISHQRKKKSHYKKLVAKLIL